MGNANRDIEEQIRNMCDRTSDRMDRRILADLFGSLGETETIRPAGKPPGFWRTVMNGKRIKQAAAAVVALAIMLPVSYGTVQAIKKYFLIAEDEVTFEYPDSNGMTTSYAYSRTVCVASSDAAGEEQARAQLEEFFRLYREGKAREVEPGIWKATLSNGEEFAYGGNPENGVVAFTEEEKARLKQQTDEINELRKAGKGERTFWKEIEENGVRIRLYNVRYTLSDGRVVTMCEGEEVAKQ